MRCGPSATARCGWAEAGARGEGGGFCHRGQHGRGDGYGEDGAGRAARRGPACPGDADAQFDRKSCVLLDVGANVDCKAHNLEQFAVMGEIYARTVLKISEPRVGLLSIGEEETKGNDLTREAFPLIKALPIHFVGNVEGRDIFSGKADVIVCDGFVGNVALKTSEGVGRFVRDVLRESLTRTVTAQVGALLSRRAFNDFRQRLITGSTAARRCLGCAGCAYRPRFVERSGHLQRHSRGLRVCGGGTNERIEQEFAGRPKRGAAGPETSSAASSDAAGQ